MTYLIAHGSKAVQAARIAKAAEEARLAAQAIEAAMREAGSLIDAYRDQCDPEWPEYVEGIAIYESDNPEEPHEGRMVARSVTCDVVSRPDDVDEDGYSESTDKWFNEVDFWCDYKMEAR